MADGFEPADRGLLHLGGELVARLRHALAHQGRALLDVDAELEEDDRRRQALARERAHPIEAVERDDRVFERLRDLVLHLGRARAGVDDVDHDDGERDVREQIGAQPREPDGPEDEEGHRDHHGEDGALDGDRGQVHGILLGLGAA
ncbi:MAG: hypothetical protein QM820_27385 [Minicystis sp.]